MKTLTNRALALSADRYGETHDEIFPNQGHRVVSLDPDEWSALCAAVEVAFDDKDPIPEGMRDAADRLWAATHPAVPALRAGQ